MSDSGPPAIPEDILAQSRVILQSDEWLVGIPLTPAAMYWWGAWTEWCTAWDASFFHSYNESGPLIVFRSRSTSFKWMLHVPRGEFRNCDNRVVSWRGFLMRDAKLSAQLLTGIAALAAIACGDTHPKS